MKWCVELISPLQYSIPKVYTIKHPHFFICDINRSKIHGTPLLHPLHPQHVEFLNIPFSHQKYHTSSRLVFVYPSCWWITTWNKLVIKGYTGTPLLDSSHPIRKKWKTPPNETMVSFWGMRYHIWLRPVSMGVFHMNRWLYMYIYI